MKVNIDNKEFIVPQSWNDLPLKQQLICYGIIMSDVPSLLDAKEVVPFKKIQLIQTLLDVDETYMKKWATDCKEVHGTKEGELVFRSELDEVMQVADFLFHTDEKTGAKSISLSLTKCPWPHLVAARRKDRRQVRWYAPKDGMKNITIYELGVTFTLFENYLKEEDSKAQKELAMQLIATLYRPTKPKTKANKRSDYQGDIRLPLLKHESTVDKRAKKLAHIPDLTLQLMLFWFASCRQQIIDNNPNVFKKSENKEAADGYGWGAVLLNLADGIVHLDDVAQRNYADALTYISYLESQRQKQKRKATTVA